MSGDQRSTVRSDGTHVQREIVLREVHTGFHGGQGYNNVQRITEEIEETLADLKEAEDVGVTPRVQVRDARKRLESIVDQLEVGDAE